MNYYVTYQESCSGVYKGQVIDVVELYRKNGIDVTLIAFLSIRGFWKNYKFIKRHNPRAIVIPAFPRQKYWRYNKLLLRFFLKNAKSVISRGIFAANICLLNKDIIGKIVYDGRGAIAAERKEYGNSTLLSMIEEMESKAVLNSDFRISVSNKLIEYWNSQYAYKSKKHIVIPCSIGASLESSCNTRVRFDFELNEQKIVLVYSGSTAAWQSFDYLLDTVEKILNSNLNVNVLFLTRETTGISALIERFGGRVLCRWVNHDEVAGYLASCDYGLLLRETSITNQVASPVKFAEYLSAGLNVIISKGIGDYSSFITQYDCGILMDSEAELNLTKNNRKSINQKLAFEHFSKSSSNIISAYKVAIEIHDN